MTDNATPTPDDSATGKTTTGKTTTGKTTTGKTTTGKTTTGKTTTGTTGTGTTGTGTTTTSTTESSKTGHRRLPAMKTDAKAIRTLVARVVWGLCVLFAVILAAAVLLIAIEANASNDLVRFVIDRADDVDLGFFDLTDPIKDFDEKVTNPAEDTKTALFNYGIAAIAWLLIGRILDRVIRP